MPFLEDGTPVTSCSNPLGGALGGMNVGADLRNPTLVLRGPCIGVNGDSKDKVEEWRARQSHAAADYATRRSPRQAVVERLKDIYGDQYFEDLDQSTPQPIWSSLRGNLSGRACRWERRCSTAAREPDVSEMLIQGRESTPRVSSHAVSTAARVRRYEPAR